MKPTVDAARDMVTLATLTLGTAALGCGSVPAKPDADVPVTTTLTITMEGTGAGTVALEPSAIGTDCTSAMGSCTYVVEVGSQVTLTASVVAGSTFVDWAGSCTGIAEQCAITIQPDPAVVVTIGTTAEHLWSEAFTGDADGALVAMDAGGNVIVAYRNVGTTNIRGEQYVGNSDLLLAKFRRDKSLAWAKQFAGGSSYFEPGAMTVASNGDVVLVAVGSSVTLDGQSLPATAGSILAVLDGETGAKKLLLSVSSTYDVSATSVAVHQDEILVAGNFKGSVNFGTGTITAAGTTVDGFLVWYSATGTPLRTRWLTGSGDEYPAVAVDDNGNVFVTGYYSGSMDLLPGATGGELPAAAGTGDAFLAQYGWDGTFKSGNRYSGPGHESFRMAMVGPSGWPVVAGAADMGVNLNPGGLGGDATGAFIAKFTADGALQWKYTTTSLGPVALDDRENVYFVASCNAQSDFGTGTIPGTGSVCAVRLDDRGRAFWAKRFNASSMPYFASLAAAPNGLHAFTGIAYSDISFGGPTIPGTGAGFVYVGGP